MTGSGEVNDSPGGRAFIHMAPADSAVINSDYNSDMTTRQMKRWLESLGCTFQKTKSGHLKIRLGSQRSVMPYHGSRQDIGKDLEERIKKQLGLK